MLTSFPMTDTKISSLKIRRLPHGGYLVSKVGSQAYTQDELFACTGIGDALGFIKDQLGDPKAGKQKSRGEKIEGTGIGSPIGYRCRGII